MSKYTLQVLFDRADRTYRFTEDIRGTVVLEAQSDLTCRKIWIDYGWRTHGKGNPDKGDQKVLLLLSKPAHLRSGDRLEHRFIIQAPNGPVTYHGHILNVDWYLSGHADIPLARNLKDEQDFLLLPCESPDGICMGNNRLIANQLPSRSQPAPQMQQLRSDIKSVDKPVNTIKANLIKLLEFLFFLVLALILIIFAHNWPGWVNAIIIVSVLIVILAASIAMPNILNAMVRTKVDVSDVRVMPSLLYQGDQLSCHIQFHVKSTVVLDKIEVKLWADETALSSGGTKLTKHTYTAYEKSWFKSYAEKFITGRVECFDCLSPVPPDAPGTFESNHNSIKWFASLKLKFARWPSWEKTFQITVLPG